MIAAPKTEPRRAWSRRFTEDEIRQILVLHRMGVKQTRIASDMGVSAVMIHHIVNGRRYAAVVAKLVEPA